MGKNKTLVTQIRLLELQVDNLTRKVKALEDLLGRSGRKSKGSVEVEPESESEGQGHDRRTSIIAAITGLRELLEKSGWMDQVNEEAEGQDLSHGAALGSGQNLIPNSSEQNFHVKIDPDVCFNDNDDDAPSTNGTGTEGEDEDEATANEDESASGSGHKTRKDLGLKGPTSEKGRLLFESLSRRTSAEIPVCFKSRSEKLLGLKKHKYDYCAKSLKKRKVHHERAHTGEKPFSCVLCHRRFSRKDTVQEHMRTHTKERPYVCQCCLISFTLKSNLNRHIKLKHTDKRR